MIWDYYEILTVTHCTSIQLPSNWRTLKIHSNIWCNISWYSNWEAPKCDKMTANYCRNLTSGLLHVFQCSWQSLPWRKTWRTFYKNAISKRRNDREVSFNRTAKKKKQRVRATKSGHHYRRNCGLGRTEKHAVAITKWLDATVSPSPQKPSLWHKPLTWPAKIHERMNQITD